MNIIVERINELRIKKGWSQNELAQKIGLSANAVYHWYKTDAMPTLRAYLRGYGYNRRAVLFRFGRTGRKFG